MHHLIVRPVFDVRLRTGGGPNPAVLDRLGGVWHDRLVPVLDRAFSDAVGPGEHVRLDRLVLDLGTVAPDDLDGALAEALGAALARELPAAMAATAAASGAPGHPARLASGTGSAQSETAGPESIGPETTGEEWAPTKTDSTSRETAGPGTASPPASGTAPTGAGTALPATTRREAEGTVAPGPEFQDTGSAGPEPTPTPASDARSRETLAAFLQTGRLPWWAAGEDRFDLDDAVRAALVDRALAGLVGGPVGLRRLAWQAAPETVRAVAEAWAPEGAALTEAVEAWHSVALTSGSPARAHATLAWALLAAARPSLAPALPAPLAEMAGGSVRARASAHAVAALAEAAGLSVAAWLDAVRPGLDVWDGAASDGPLPLRLLSPTPPNTHAPASPTRTPPPSQHADALTDDPSSPSAARSPGVPAEPSARPDEDATSRDLSPSHAVSPGASVPEHTPTADDVRRGLVPPPPRPDTAADTPEASEADVRVPETAEPPRAADGPALDREPLYIRDAGLVLLAPFLPRFLDTLGLLDGGAFARPAAQRRAVALVASLASGRDRHAEPELVLAKLLCGLPLDEPVEPEIEASDAERAERAALLNAVVSHWGAVGSTSAEGLRSTFLVRDGRLDRSDDAWRLTVDRRGVDVLVDRVPWPLGLVALRWMPAPLHVTW